MRHIALQGIIEQILSESGGIKDKRRLFRGHKKLARMSPEMRQYYIRQRGPSKWSPIKNRLVAVLGKKCWYTEVELVGAHLTIDHFRPVCDYWYLAFDIGNYRVACPFANSPEHNRTHGYAGGKGNSFPLLGAGIRAKGKNKLKIEKPLILDPCKKEDCELVAFEIDGRPILNPAFADDPFAQKRLEESKILLNLDHPDFNSKREQLCLAIAEDVKVFEQLPESATGRDQILRRMEERLAPYAPFSSAARHYLQLHRDLPWVEQILSKL